MRTSKEEMIENQLKARGIVSHDVINAMQAVDRENFVPEKVKKHAYEDGPLHLGDGQTISQPYIVAYMAEVLGLSQYDRVLEIGAGSGYNAAVIAKIAGEIYSVEIISWLAEYARENIASAGISNVQIKEGDGRFGWKEKSPFDAIVLTAATENVPDELKKQLRIGGRLMAPVGKSVQELVLMEKHSETEFSKKYLAGVRFVPLRGQTQG